MFTHLFIICFFASFLDENHAQIKEQIAHLQGQLHSFVESQLSEEDQRLQQQIEDEIKNLQRSLASARRVNGTRVAPREPATAAYLRDYIRKAEKQRRNLIMHADVLASTLNGNGEDLDLVKLMCREGAVSPVLLYMRISSETCEVG